jgi:Protein of unknown function (DUF2950)
MSMTFIRRGLAAIVCTIGLTLGALAQTPTPQTTNAEPQLQTFATPEAAADTLTEALRKDDDKMITAILGTGWRDLVPGTKEEEDKSRADFLKAWDEAHKVVPDGDNKAKVEVGTTGFVMPIPLVKENGTWHYDVDAGRIELQARYIGRNELRVIQTLLAIVDAEQDYSAQDPMKTGVATYARRLLSTPGKKDGLYWETQPGEPDSPLGPLVAKAQAGATAGDGYWGYHYRLLYGQGPDAKGGAYSYLANGRMIGGFGVIAWPVTYGDTGVMTFIVNQDGVVYQKDLGPDTPALARGMKAFNPDDTWTKV